MCRGESLKELTALTREGVTLILDEVRILSLEMA